MNDQNYTTTFTVDQTPEEAFAAINNVRGWWTEDIQGNTDKLGEEFKYQYKEFHKCTIKVTELVPNEKVAWFVVDNYFSFDPDTTEWKNTEIVFEISRKENKTEVRFTHVGLTPEYSCYEACKDGWGTYINESLKNLIATGKGQPNVGEAKTDSEKNIDV
jgi:hypothetical protein